MGKTTFSSCCYFICPSRSSMVNLIFHDGSRRVVTGKRLAGEIMFEFPDCMVCHADSFYIGNPIPSLNIDDRLRKGDTYFILPLDYFPSCSVLSASTLATLGSNPRQSSTPVNFRNPIFQYVKAENGRVLIKVSPEFIIKLFTRGNEDQQEDIITSNSDINAQNFYLTDNKSNGIPRVESEKDSVFTYRTPEVAGSSRGNVKVNTCGLPYQEVTGSSRGNGFLSRGGHEFKPWKQPLTEMQKVRLRTIHPCGRALSRKPRIAVALVHRAAFHCILQ
ncbi:hypothetical protein BC332_14369 [Capsicum chinense]|nr:hypothetical protein BC332_14369 [Capsicum chinense]